MVQSNDVAVWKPSYGNNRACQCSEEYIFNM